MQKMKIGSCEYLVPLGSPVQNALRLSFCLDVRPVALFILFKELELATKIFALVCGTAQNHITI